MGIGKITSWLYALGSFFKACTNSSLIIFGNTFLLEVAHVKPYNLAVLMLFVKIANGLNDPLVGFLSDNSKRESGKRKVWVSYSAGPCAILYVLAWIVPPDSYVKELYYALIYLLLDALMSISEINYDALASEMTVTYDERMPLIYKKTMVYMCSSLLSSVLISHYLSIYPGARTYTLAALVTGVVGVPLLLLGVSRCKERDYMIVQLTDLLPDDQIQDNDRGAYGNPERQDVFTVKIIVEFYIKIKQDFASILNNKNYLVLAGVNTLVSMTITVMMTLLLMYVQYVLEDEDKSSAVFIILSVQSGILVGLNLFAVAFHAKLVENKKFVLVCVFAVMIVDSLLFIKFKNSFVLEFVYGACVAGTTVLIQAMLPDVIDVAQNEHARRTRQDGSYYGLFALFQKTGVALAIAAVNFTLAAKNFSHASAKDDKAVAEYVQYMFVGTGPLLLCGASLLLSQYNITKAVQTASIHQESTKDLLSVDF